MHVFTDAAYVEANSIPEPNSGCWLWLRSLNKDGYGMVKIKPRASHAAHRTSWIAHHGAIPSGLIVRHKCDNPPCVNPSHLELGTNAQNSADMVARNRQTAGIRNGMAALSDADVLAIRQMRAAGIMLKDIGKIYSITFQNVHRIVSRKSWKHLP